jgi:hemoglobin-like flavoprotein
MAIRRHPLSPSTEAPGLRPDVELADRHERSAAVCGPLTGPGGGKLAQRFYDRLFAKVPPVRSMFPADMTKQVDKLSQTLEHVIVNLRSADDLSKDLKELGARHVGYGAKPEHYLIVIEEVVGAMQDVGGAAFTQEDADDWRLALRLISERMIGERLP